MVELSTPDNYFMVMVIITEEHKITGPEIELTLVQILEFKSFHPKISLNYIRRRVSYSIHRS